MQELRKDGKIYIFILIIWFELIRNSYDDFGDQISAAMGAGVIIPALVILSTLFICYFWLNGIKDIVYTLYYYLSKKEVMITPPKRALLGDNSMPKVALVYCTYDDFDGRSLAKSMQQDYKKYHTVILDDSVKKPSWKKIDAFAKKHNIQVIRRNSHEGHKAGNLNNYLKKGKYDYFVILDSDEIIPKNFISRSLDYFAFYSNAGIVQANHVATRNNNKFMNMFAKGVDAHWEVYQSVKNHHGFLSLLGHGAMISKECYEAAGGFPHTVAEDICFTIHARDKGYMGVFAPDIICHEQYPVDYLSFKKRHSKWTQGNMEFIKNYSYTIFKSKMSWFEKIDIVLFTYSLPLTVLFFFYLVINVAILPLLGHSIIYPLWMILPTILCLGAPMLNDFIFYFKKVHPLHLLNYLFHAFLLYGSMFYISLKSSILSIIKGSTFIVTPKRGTHTTLLMSLKSNYQELTFAILLFSICVAINGSPLPCILLVISGLASVYLSFMSNNSKRGLKQKV